LPFFVIGCAAAFLSVALGAFGAHVLKDTLSPENLSVFQTGVQYQMYHALALIGVGIVSHFGKSRALTWSGILFTLGIVLFSGSLYVLSTTGIKNLGIITPFGGLSFLAGWISFLIAGLGLL